MTMREAVLTRATEMLNSSFIEFEAAHFCESEYTNPDLSVQQNAQILVNKIQIEREAERAFFKAHPELNP